MFDTYYKAEVTRSVTEHVHEHRAPTDESVQLLKEMEQAAREKISDSLILKSNHVHAVVQSNISNFDHTIRYRITYDLNGQRRVVDYHLFQDDTNTNPLVRAYTELSKDIAEFIMRGLLPSALKG